jgi:hypothetical protein
VAIFAVVLLAVQTIEKTPLYFSAGCAVFILIAALAFNTAGGLTRASGAYIFCYSVLVVLIGICYKALLGEPAQTNLLVPELDIATYIGSIVGIYGAVVMSHRLTRKTGLLQNVLKDADMYRASVGCIIFGSVGGTLIALLGESASKVQTAFNQLNQLVPLGIILGVMYEIRRSGGTRSTNLFVVGGGIYNFILGGIIAFSKQGQLMAFYCWLLPVCALRYRLSIAQMLSCLAALFIVFHYLVPYSQYGRDQIPEGATISQRLAIETPLLEHPEETRRLYLEQQDSIDPSERGLNSYYNTPQGFWERLQMVSVDDKLNYITDQGKVYGLSPVAMSFLNVIPHVIWPNKPGMNFGNAYAHEMARDTAGEGDTSTGIAVSPTGEAYHLAKWAGVLTLAPILWCMFFTVFDSLLGDIRTTPWGLLAMAMISHAAPEAGITGTIGLVTFGVETLVFCAFFAKWFAPLLAVPILGADRHRGKRETAFSAAQ